MPALILTAGPRAGDRLALEGALTIGREHADVVIDDAELSRSHARFTPDGRGGTLEDLGSLNGTFVDGVKVEAPVALTGGEQIRLGLTTIGFEADPAPLADPKATRITEVPVGADATVVRPIPTPDVTVVRDRPVVPAPEPKPEPATMVAEPPEPTPEPATMVEERREVAPEPATMAEPPQPEPEPARVPAFAATAAQPAPAAAFGSLAHGAARHGGLAVAARGGIATRQLTSAALTFAIIIATAVALVLYFAAR